jgi:transcription elongation GreA/GreB family factor
MDKRFLLEQLGAHLRDAVQQSHTAHVEAAQDARSGANRAVNMARGQALRSERARAELDALDGFSPQPLPKGARIAIGALVEVEGDDDTGGKTLFLAPVGGGLELEGPGGDGFFQVVTPISPLGRALLGKRVGEVAEVMVAGELREYEITWVG